MAKKPETRKEAQRRISDEIDARDRADIDKGDRKFGVWRVGDTKSPMYPGEYGTGTKSDAYGYEDAVRRQNLRGYAAEGFNADTGKGISKKEGDETRKRLLERYGVKKKAKGGTVKSSASKRADGCAIKGKTKGRMV